MPTSPPNPDDSFDAVWQQGVAHAGEAFPPNTPVLRSQRTPGLTVSIPNNLLTVPGAATVWGELGFDPVTRTDQTSAQYQDYQANPATMAKDDLAVVFYNQLTEVEKTKTLYEKWRHGTRLDEWDTPT